MTAASPGRLAGRLALVTGASRGLGAAAALAFAREGAHCVLVARTVGGLEALDDRIKAEGGAATLVPLDVTDGPGIDRLGAALYERFGRLDVLLGNAGILGVLSPIGHIDPAVFEQVMAVNVTANWRLIRSLDPLLRRSDAGRAIFVTSGIANKGVPYWSAYAASKAALDVLATTYAAEVAHTAVRVNLYNPGPMRTSMRAQAFPGEPPEQQVPPEAHAEGLIRLALPSCTMNGQWVAGDEACAYLDAFVTSALWMPTLMMPSIALIDAELEGRGVLPFVDLGLGPMPASSSVLRQALLEGLAVTDTGKQPLHLGKQRASRDRRRTARPDSPRGSPAPPAGGRCRGLRHCARSGRCRRSRCSAPASAFDGSRSMARRYLTIASSNFPLARRMLPQSIRSAADAGALASAAAYLAAAFSSSASSALSPIATVIMPDFVRRCASIIHCR